MAFNRLVFTVLFLSVSCYATQPNVPAFIWGDLAETSSKANPLKTISSSEFLHILKGEIENEPFTVVFADESLSVEDLSRKNSEGETSFPFLHAQLESSYYLPSVENPLKTIESYAEPEEIDHLKLTEDSLSRDIEGKSNKILVINLSDAKEGESRPDLLRRHDEFMADTFDKLKKEHGKVIAIYTAENPSWTILESHSRVRRQTEGNTVSQDLSLDGLRLYAKHIEIREGNNTVSLNGVPVAHTEFNSTLQTMNTTLTFGDNSMILNFKEKAGYWYLDYITLNPGTATEEDLQPDVDLFAITGFSYRCGPRVVFSTSNVTRTLVFENLQIQPYFKTTNETVPFGDAFDCVGFFTAPIWSGIMVTFILLAITFYGIMMMMDIRTMDRFDDPKGKTITINTLD